MTESEWNEGTDVETMLAFVAGRNAPPGAALPVCPLSERKLRLFLVACCRRQQPLFVSPEATRALQVAEELADGRGNQEDLANSHKAVVDLQGRALLAMMEARTKEGLITVHTVEAAMVALGKE